MHVTRATSGPPATSGLTRRRACCHCTPGHPVPNDCQVEAPSRSPAPKACHLLLTVDLVLGPCWLSYRLLQIISIRPSLSFFCCNACSLAKGVFSLPKVLSEIRKFSALFKTLNPEIFLQPQIEPADWSQTAVQAPSTQRHLHCQHQGLVHHWYYLGSLNKFQSSCVQLGLRIGHKQCWNAHASFELDMPKRIRCIIKLRQSVVVLNAIWSKSWTKCKLQPFHYDESLITT